MGERRFAWQGGGTPPPRLLHRYGMPFANPSRGGVESDERFLWCSRGVPPHLRGVSDFGRWPIHEENGISDFGRWPIHEENGISDFGRCPIHVERGISNFGRWTRKVPRRHAHGIRPRFSHPCDELFREAAGCQPLAQRGGIDEGAVNPLGRGVEDAMDDAEMIRPVVPPKFRPFLRRSGVRGG